MIPHFFNEIATFLLIVYRNLWPLPIDKIWDCFCDHLKWFYCANDYWPLRFWRNLINWRKLLFVSESFKDTHDIFVPSFEEIRKLILQREKKSWVTSKKKNRGKITYLRKNKWGEMYKAFFIIRNFLILCAICATPHAIADPITQRKLPLPSRKKPFWNGDAVTVDGNSWSKYSQKYDCFVVNIHYEGFILIEKWGIF